MQAMDHDNLDVTERRPHTVTVLVLLTGTALIFSYLGAYAIPGALITANLLAPWPAGEDPRPRHLVTGFVSLMAAFVFCATAFRVLSSRQLRRIDAMAEEGH